MKKNVKKTFDNLLLETMAEMQAINQPALGGNYNISSIQNVPAPGYNSKITSLLPTEVHAENKDNIEKSLYVNIKNIVLNSKTNISLKIRQIIKLINDYQNINQS